MKKALFLIALAVFATCCNRTTRLQPDFGVVEVDTLVGGEGIPCHVALKYLTINNSGVSEALASIERSNIEYFFQIEGFAGSAREAARRVVEESAAYSDDMAGVMSAEDVEFSLTAEAEASVVDTLLCYTIARSGYMGGAHGSHSLESHIYSLHDGFELAWRDLYTDEELDLLAAAVRRRLEERFDAAGDEALAAAGLFPDYIGLPETFIPTSDGLTLHYNPYEIGCYALGAIELKFSNAELAEILGR